MLKIHEYIYEFDPLIYPQKIWITVNPKQEDLDDVFEDCKLLEDCLGQCLSVRKKENNKTGELIVFENIEQLRKYSVVMHECAHAALDIFNYISADVSTINQEPFCYFIGWIADCCNQVLKDLC